MKNGLLIWNVVLTLATGFLLVKQFGGSKGTKGNSKPSASDSSGTQESFRIAYFEMDSIASNFGLVKDLRKELQSREDAINTEMNNRSRAMQQKFDYYQKLAQAGNLSETQSDVASKEMKSMDDEMKNRRQQLDQEYNNFMVTRQNEIKTKIEDFLKDYNKRKNYSYIVSYEQGLFYYKDTAYNITADVVKGLNEKYATGKKN
jgi:outer membrane protein